MPEYIRSYLVNCGGINNSVSDELIADNELADASNIIPDYSGGANLIKRPGLVANSAPAAAYPANVALWTVPSAFVGKNGKYYAESWTTSVPGSVTNIYDLDYNSAGTGTATVLYTNANFAGNLTSWCSFAGYDLYADVSAAVKTSDGTNFTAIANIPASRIVIYPYNNYLFAIVSGSTSLRWSDQEDPETWDVTHDLTFALSDAYDSLTAMREYGGELAIFTRKRVLFLQGYGPLDFTVTRTLKGAGTYRQDMTCFTPIGLFWWSEQHGLCWTQDGRTIDFAMLRKIPQTFFSYSYQTPLNGFMFWCPDRLCVSTVMYTYGASPQFMRMDYYPMRDAFYLSPYVTSASSFQPKAMAVDDLNYDTYSKAVYYMIQRDATATTGKLYARRESETLSTDIGDLVTAYIKTKRSYGPVGAIRDNESNKVQLTTSLGTAGAITYGYYQDNATTLTQSFSPTIGTGVQDTEFGINAHYRKIQHYLSDALAGRTKYIALHELGD